MECGKIVDFLRPLQFSFGESYGEYNPILLYAKNYNILEMYLTPSKESALLIVDLLIGMQFFDRKGIIKAIYIIDDKQIIEYADGTKFKYETIIEGILPRFPKRVIDYPLIGYYYEDHKNHIKIVYKN